MQTPSSLPVMEQNTKKTSKPHPREVFERAGARRLWTDPMSQTFKPEECGR